ncbi:MAG TPA: hypothetical protein V6D25_06455 [Leptolyngbyaceae cyanobacterium]
MPTTSWIELGASKKKLRRKYCPEFKNSNEGEDEVALFTVGKYGNFLFYL